MATSPPHWGRRTARAEAELELSGDEEAVAFFHASGDGDSDGDAEEQLQYVHGRAHARGCERQGALGSIARRAVGSFGFVALLVGAAWRCGHIAPTRLAGALVATSAEGQWKPVDFGTLPYSIQVIHIPELPSDMARLEDLREQYDRYIVGGRRLLIPFAGVDPDFWKKGGRFEEYRRTLMQINTDPADPWWKAFYWEDPSDAAAQGRAHHVGCMASHLMVWWNARQQDVQTVLVSEVDGGPRTFALSTLGCAGDLPGVAKAAAQQAPVGWHLILLDAPAVEEQDNLTISESLGVPGASAAYQLRPWFGSGYAGTALMLVSRRWLDTFPRIVQRYKADEVDAWLGSLCGNLIIECYFVQAQSPQLFCPDRHSGT